MTKEVFIERCRETHGYKYKYIDVPDKILSSDYVKILYDGKLYTQKVVKHLLGKCPEKNTPKNTTEDFIERSIKVWGDRYDYSLVKYEGAHKKVIIIDNVSGIKYLQSPSNHLAGSSPSCLSDSDFLEISKIISDYKYSYDNCNYVNKITNVKMCCPEHGDFEVKPFNHLNYGTICSKCDESLFSKKVIKYMNKHRILFYRQHRFDGCKGDLYQLPFDFYIPSLNTCIEFDGIQHFQPVEHFGGLESYERLKKNDKIKNDYCEDNYINIIRIKYDQLDRINEILDNNLRTLINMKRNDF